MLTLHMLVRDEEQLLPPLLEYVKPYVQEMVIVIDNATTDRTEEIVVEYSPHYIRTDLNMNYATARNLGLDRVITPWVLHLDADEWPTKELMDSLPVFLGKRNAMKYSGLLIHRHNLVDGQPIGAATHEWHVRVFQSRYRFVGRIHEMIGAPPLRLLRVPEKLCIQHYKTQERQQRLNVHYEQWPEQRALSQGK